MSKAPVILPGHTIGVLGGGQLGRMLALQGSQMGYRFITLDPTEDSPCGQVASEQIIAQYDDADAARMLAQVSDVITYEFENVNAGVAKMLMKDSYVPQGSELLYITQHRLREKKAIEEAGVQVAPYTAIENEAQLSEAVQELGLPCVLKTATGGYDGKGQWVIRSIDEVPKAFEALSKSKTELVLEKFIRFQKELSVIAARNSNGQVQVFPPAENIHKDNILHLSIVPARVSAEIIQRAEQLALQIAKSMQVIGLIAVEMFLTEDGQLFVNELAPRPHNSGHYTMEACKTSQFEQHIRAICNLPLSSTELLTPVVMVNLLGEHIDPLMNWMEKQHTVDHDPTLKIHLYGKSEVKPKRKMGHINILADVDTALDWIEKTGIWVNQKEDLT